MSIRQLHDYFQQRYGPMPMVVHHTMTTEDSQGEDMDQNEQIKHAIKVLDQDVKYYEVTMPRESQFLQGYKRATAVAKRYLKAALLPEPQHEEAWQIRVTRNGERTYETVALRNEDDGYWEDLDEMFYDDSAYYEIELLHKLEPKKG